MGALRSQSQTEPPDRVLERQALRAELGELALFATEPEVLHDAALRALLNGLHALAGWVVEVDLGERRPKGSLLAQIGLPKEMQGSLGEWAGPTLQALRDGLPAIHPAAQTDWFPASAQKLGAVQLMVLPLSAESGVRAAVWLATASYAGPTEGAQRFAEAVVRILGAALARLSREQSLVHFRETMDLLPDGVLVMRADGKVLDANQTALAAYGYSREEVLGLSILDLRAGATLPEVLWQMRRAVTSGLTFETVHRRKDGTQFRCEVRSRGALLHGEHLLISVVRPLDPDGASQPH